MWILSIFRSILAFIDQLIVWIIVNAYGLFTEIIDVKFFDNETIQYFSRRIYALLAIFMLFKIAFSLINYLVNPDSFSDKEKGFGKIVTNVFIVLLLIAVTPTVFDQAYELQKMIISNHVIENVILGMPLKDTDSTGTDGKSSARGQNMAFVTYSAFISPATDYPGIDDKCTNMYVDGALTGECANALRTALSDEEYNKLNSALQEQNPYALLDNDLITEYKDNKFVMSYIPIISTIAGGLVAWVLILFCIDVAIRLVKLGFLQLMAPIPIISYIDPKSGKDGMFKKWLKECGKSYADVFLRIAAISFCIFLINILITNESTYISTGQAIGFNPLLRVFILIGILLFAKEVPKLIETLTGIKLGGFSLDPRKKLKDTPLIGKKLESGLNWTGNAAKKLGGATKNLAFLGAGVLGRKIDGASGEMFSSKFNSLKNGVGSVGTFMSDKYKGFAKNHPEFTDELTGLREGIFGGTSNKRVDANKKITDTITAMEDRAKDKIKTGAAGSLSEEYFRRQEVANGLRGQLERATDDVTRENLQKEIARTMVENTAWLEGGEYKDSRGNKQKYDGVYAEYIDSYDDGTMNSFKSNYDELVDVYKADKKASAKERHSQLGAMKAESSAIARHKMEAESRAKANKKDK